MFKTNHIMSSIISAAAVACASPQAVFAEVSAVVSLDIAPYRDVLRGFKETIDDNVNGYIYGDIVNKEPESGGSRLKNSNLLFTVGTDAFYYVLNNVKDTPVIHVFVMNPEEAAWKGRGNIAGINMIIPPYQQFSMLKEIVPGLKKIGVIYDPARTRSLILEADEAAAGLGLTIVAKKASTTSDAIMALKDLEGKVDALWMVPDSTVLTRESLEYMLLVSFKGAIPVIGLSEKYVKNGALLAFSFDNEDIGRQAGEIGREILAGKEAWRIPLQRPRKFKVCINLKTASKIGIKVPQHVIKKADMVYQ